MTTIENISPIDTADEEPDPLGQKLDRLCGLVENLEQLHSEYFGCNPRVPGVFKVGKKVLNSLTNTIEIVYRSAEDVKIDIISLYRQLRGDFQSIETNLDRDTICATDRAKLAFIEDELHNPSYKRFGLL